MKQVITLFLFAVVLTSCGSSQSGPTQTAPTTGYSVYENIDVRAFYQTMPRGMFIRTLSGPRRTYKISTPLQDGTRYRVTIRVPNYSSSEIKEAQIIAHTQL